MSWKSKILNRLQHGSQKPDAAESGHRPPPGNQRGATIIDNPVRRSEDDTLGRNDSAQSFAQYVLTLDATAGVVVGVLGAWGSGKTSFINLSRSEFDRAGVQVLDFNPWMFSGAEQLMEKFFTELAAQLRVKREFAEIAQMVEEYGEAFSGLTWLPVVGPWIDRARQASKIVTKVSAKGKISIGSRRAKLESALAGLSHPIVVVLDDIDRLSSSEIRDVFKLVRLTASFPNVAYILAFDRTRVEVALSEQGVPGRDYLEKILQLAVDLPAVPAQVILREITGAIDRALSGIDDPGPFDAEEWPDLLMEIIRPLLGNMRDVRRYATAIRGTVAALRGQIALADVLALDAIRTFLPDVYGQIGRTVEALTTPSGTSRPDATELKASIDSLVNGSGKHQEIVRAMIRRLFPAARWHIENYHFGPEFKSEWLRERRVAHEEILKLYLERVAGHVLQAFTNAEQAFDLMADASAFDGYLRSLDPERLEDVIGSLEHFTKEFTAEHVVPGIVILLNLLPKLPERSRGMFDLGPDLIVTRVVFRLLRSLGNSDEVEAAARKILPQLTSLSARLELIDTVGYREGVGSKFVSEAAATEFERIWRSDVRAASPSDLEREKGLLGLLLLAKRGAAADEPPLLLPEAPALTLAILRAARTEVKSQSMGKRAVRRASRIEWDALILLFGSEVEIRGRIERLKESKPDGEEDLLDLVNKYLEGWRPGRFYQSNNLII